MHPLTTVMSLMMSSREFSPGLNPVRFKSKRPLKWIITRYKDMCIIYGDMPKSGSSTIRIWLKTLGTNNMKSYKLLNITQKELRVSVIPLALREECFVFTFVRDPVDRYISALYESHRSGGLKRPDEVNVTALTYAFVQANNTKHTWIPIDPKENSIFSVGQLDYIRNVPFDSETKSTFDFLGNLAHWETDWIEVHSRIEAKFGSNPWNPSRNPTPQHHGASSASHGAREILSDDLVQIVCKLYADDYCCLHLPVPELCSIDCHE
jgi:hypothetical protein